MHSVNMSVDALFFFVANVAVYKYCCFELLILLLLLLTPFLKLDFPDKNF